MTERNGHVDIILERAETFRGKGFAGGLGDLVILADEVRRLEGIIASHERRLSGNPVAGVVLGPVSGQIAIEQAATAQYVDDLKAIREELFSSRSGAEGVRLDGVLFDEEATVTAAGLVENFVSAGKQPEPHETQDAAARSDEARREAQRIKMREYRARMRAKGA